VLSRTALFVLAAAIAAQATLAAPAPRARTVPCSESIDRTRFPYLGNRDPAFRAHLVLGAISVPPAYVPQVASTGEEQWPYFSKWGMVVRADGRPVTVSVPTAWRDRLAISWGNGGHGVFQSIRFAGCRGGASVGNAYAGGFFLRSRSVCAPLRFEVGGRGAVVRFGIGRRCR
jgi:hypothetical protein